MKRIGALLSALVSFTIIALMWSKDFPILSAYIVIFLVLNCMSAFISIFAQGEVIRLYEANVFERKSGFFDHYFQYLAIGISGINYNVQVIFRSFSFVVNKILSILFLFSLLWMLVWITMIFH